MSCYFYQMVGACRRLFYLLIRTRLDEAETAAYKLKTRQYIGAACADGIVLSFPKSGRTWIETMLSRLYVKRLGLPETKILEFEEDRYSISGLPYLLFTHDYAHVTGGKWLIGPRRSRHHYRGTPTLLIVRHPIDIAVSMYFQQSRREGNPIEGEIFDFVKSQQGGVRTAIEFMNIWAKELPRVRRHRILRYEDFVDDAGAGLREVVEFFGLSFGEEEIADAVAFASFGNLQQLEKEGKIVDWRFSEGSDDADRLKVRRGKVGGYKDYFDAAQCRELEEIVAETLDPSYGY